MDQKGPVALPLHLKVLHGSQHSNQVIQWSLLGELCGTALSGRGQIVTSVCVTQCTTTCLSSACQRVCVQAGMEGSYFSVGGVGALTECLWLTLGS